MQFSSIDRGLRDPIVDLHLSYCLWDTGTQNCMNTEDLVPSKFLQRFTKNTDYATLQEFKPIQPLAFQAQHLVFLPSFLYNHYGQSRMDEVV